MADEFSGRLREPVVIERAVLTADDSGNATPSWTEVARSWAELSPVERAAPVIGEGRVQRAVFRALMRSGATLGLADRLRWQGRSFRILQIAGDPRLAGRIMLTIEEQG
ncbi:MAG: head-tail adaptor protein [Polymorphobacter sp.]